MPDLKTQTATSVTMQAAIKMTVRFVISGTKQTAIDWIQGVASQIPVALLKMDS
jgi:hypothetical protein